ncbi:MAG: hypothetical protein JW963_00460 [Anaerolineales bacterium]|nr:hypothetical protein [Anaerolineales bacterium]
MQLEKLNASIFTTQRTSAYAPGACGELVQGQFENGDDFLVTLPVDLRAEVRVELDPTASLVQGTPIRKEKTRLAVRKMLDYLRYSNVGATFTVTSDIPEGKGMASSTADILAACRAVAQAVGQPLSPEEISRIAIEIEPSDGLMYPGVVCYNHRRGELLETLGALPPMDILAVDLGGYVDTLQFNRKPKDYTVDELDTLRQAYEFVKAGVHGRNLEEIGRAATLSARVNQRLLPKPYLDTLIALAAAHGAHGVCIAHSGTVAGLLFDRGANGAFENARDAIWCHIDPTLVIYALQSL